MEKETLKRIFDFLDAKENLNQPVVWKLKTNIPLTDDELHFYDDLDLSELEIETLPENLYIEGNLILNYSEIKSLQKGLKVNYDLSLQFTEIKSLPEGLEIGGDLDLRFSSITSLPKGLEVGGGLYIYGTPLKKYTHDELIEMIKPGFIKGEIYN